MINKKKVKRVLDNMATIDTTKVTKKEGNLDVKAFNELPEVKEAVRKLVTLGVTRKWLMKYFMVAGMILTFSKEQIEVA